MTVHTDLHGDIAVLRLDHPPLNSLNLVTRSALLQALERAQADPAVRAIVLAGSARAFSSGADIAEFDSPVVYQHPKLPTLIDAIEQSSKPVVAALQGAAMGGGLELALGCHHRIAEPACRLALPEVKLGLVPGAGGTQRLPRALGVEAALNLIVSGEPVRADAVARIPGQALLDRLAASADTLLPEALALARQAADAAATGQPLPRLRERAAQHPLADGYFQFARTLVQGQARHLPAPPRALELVQAAVRQPFEAGLALERQAFLDLMQTPESTALRHVFAAERAAGRITDVPASTPTRPITHVAVVGAGTMGSGIAMACLNAGLAVTLLETQNAALERGLATIRNTYEGQVRKGRLTPEALAERLARLAGTVDDAGIAQADLVIEAVFEDMAVKEQVFRRLDAVMKPGAILASNTSTLDLDRIAGFTRRPQDVVGLHFFSPAHVMKLLEVVRGARTAPDVLASAMAFGRALRKTCVVAGVCDGFIGNRMLDPYFRQAAFLLEEGCTPQQVDRAIEAFGFAMGPFRMSDMAGNDVGWAIRKRHYAEKPDVRHSHLPDRLCEAGRFGQKVGAGWYDHPPGQREPATSPAVQALAEQHRAALGLVPRAIGDAEIVQRLVLALVNEGARVLQEGVAARASDIDMVYLTGYGFPAWRGGPMHWAEQQGLYQVAQAMRRFARAPHGDAAFWQPAALIERLAATGGSFSSRAPSP